MIVDQFDCGIVLAVACSSLVDLRSLDEASEEVGGEGPDPQAEAETGHHQVGRCAGLLWSNHLRPGDHADGPDVAVADAEEHHDDDVGGVALEGHIGNISVSGPDVAEEEERDEDKSLKTILIKRRTILPSCCFLP